MVLNAVARLVVVAGKYDHITPVFRDVLHWLLISQRIQCKDIRWLSLPSTVPAVLAQPTFDRSACRSPMVGHISALLNVVICWFLESELSLSDGVSTLQLQSSGTRFRHGCALPPLVVDNSEMSLKPTSSYKPTHDSVRTFS